MATQTAHEIRDRILPMLQVTAENYRTRVPAPFPVVIDAPERGTVGIELDNAYTLYLNEEDGRLFADFYYRNSRWDTRSSASREKFGGAPIMDRRELPLNISDQGLRNLIAELCSRYNFQQTLIHMTDT